MSATRAMILAVLAMAGAASTRHAFTTHHHPLRWILSSATIVGVAIGIATAPILY